MASWRATLACVLAAVTSTSAARVDFVVAHCHEPAEWLADARDGLLEGAPGTSIALRIYEKCEDARAPQYPVDGWASVTYTYLPNKGEECLAYLTHIVGAYKNDSIADYTVFFQGDSVVQGRYVRDALREFGFSVVSISAKDEWRSLNDHQYIAQGESDEACAGKINCMSSQGPDFAECLGEMWLHLGIGPRPPVIAVFANAQFGVSADRVLARPVSFYEDLLAEFNRPSDVECFKLYGPKGRPYRGTCALLEYMWPAIFGEAAELDPAHTMRHEYGTKTVNNVMKNLRRHAEQGAAQEARDGQSDGAREMSVAAAGTDSSASSKDEL